MVDEYSKLAGGWEPAAFTGKSVEKGGSRGRDIATGFGGFIILREFLQAPSSKFPASADSAFVATSVEVAASAGKQAPTIAVQGFGNVGANFARIAAKNGFKIVALSDSKGAIFNSNGFDVEELLKIQKERGVLNSAKCSLEEAAGRSARLSEPRPIGAGGKCKVISNKDLLELDVDILVPAALENQITGENAKDIKAKVILELANGPTTEEAGKILEERGIVVIPDILANGGGVVGSYFEWLQSKEKKWMDEVAVLQKIEDVMVRAFAGVKKAKEETNLPWRKAAYVRAVSRIVEAVRKDI